MNRTDALIGYTGFVGTTLLKQHLFKSCYRSTNIADIAGQSFDSVVCAGASAQKWIANRDPEADRRNIDALIECLTSVQCRIFILISTVDVFKSALGVNEDTPVDEAGLHPYGLHRRRLEKCIAQAFPNHLIVRLAGLVGPGLRKNILFDLLHNNALDAIDSRAMFQFYPMVNLWYDIQIALQAGLKLLHLTAAPISVAEIAHAGFGRRFHHTLPHPPAAYDFQSKYVDVFGGQGAYQYSKRDTIQATRAYAQSEPVSVKTLEQTHR